MQLINKYYYFENAIKSEICDKIINLGLKTIDNNKKIDEKSIYGRTFGDSQKQTMGDDAISKEEKTQEEVKKHKDKKFFDRDAKVCWLNEQWMFDLFRPYVDMANKESGWRFEIDYCENMQFTVYEKDGFHGWHFDGGSDYLQAYCKAQDSNNPVTGYGRETNDENMIGKVRKISMTLNLTDPNDYDGGNLKFDFGLHNDKSDRFHICKEIRPRGSIIFFPSFNYHIVTPVTRGTRYSLVGWFLGKPFK